MLFFGFAVGVFVGLVGFVLSPPHFNVVALLFTLGTFFIVGCIFCERGTDFVWMCAISIFMLLSFVTSIEMGDLKRKDFSPFSCFVAFLAWLALVVCALVRF